MKLSAIQLEAYALSTLTFQANQEHKPDQPVAYREEDIVIDHGCVRDAEDDRVWKVALSIRIQPRAEANAPYHISLQLSGLVRALPQLESKDLETLLRVTGASLLYGVAREVVRQVTSIGPFPPLLIPSINFRPDSPSPSALPDPRAATPPNPSSEK